MFDILKGKIGKEQGFFAFLSKNSEEKHEIQAIEEHIHNLEKRDSIRIYVELPIQLSIILPDGTREIFQGKSLNISEFGTLIHFWIKKETWDGLKNHLDKVELEYRFLRPKELTECKIEGKIKRFFKNIDKKKKLIELEIGIENQMDQILNRVNLTSFLNAHIKEGIKQDISTIETINSSRNLSELEENMLKFLLGEQSRLNLGSASKKEDVEE